MLPTINNFTPVTKSRPDLKRMGRRLEEDEPEDLPKYILITSMLSGEKYGMLTAGDSLAWFSDFLRVHQLVGKYIE